MYLDNIEKQPERGWGVKYTGNYDELVQVFGEWTSTSASSGKSMGVSKDGDGNVLMNYAYSPAVPIDPGAWIILGDIYPEDRVGYYWKVPF